MPAFGVIYKNKISSKALDFCFIVVNEFLTFMWFELFCIFYRSVFPHMVQKKLYMFLKHGFEKWPLDSSFRLVGLLLMLLIIILSLFEGWPNIT